MKKRFNKKLLIFGLPILAIGLVVAAVISYYAIFTVTLNVNQPISVDGEEWYEGRDLGDLELGGGIYLNTDKPIRVSNTGGIAKTVTITSVVVNTEGTLVGDAVDVSYVGKLLLTKKNIADWAINPSDQIEITYTVVGETFVATGVPDGYTLIYYKDNPANVDDDERLTVLGTIGGVGQSLPHTSDWNVGDSANYCDMANEFDNYEHCKGAKLWAVPDENIDGSGNLIWLNPEDFYFETDLIWYSDSIDTLTVPANSFIEFYPRYEVSDFADGGEYTIQTTVA